MPLFSRPHPARLLKVVACQGKSIFCQLTTREGFLRRRDRRRWPSGSAEARCAAWAGHQAGTRPQDLQQGARPPDQKEDGVDGIGS